MRLTSHPQFGLGLVSLGRRWGFHPSPLPSREQIHQLLTTAIDHGVRIFDTAPAYGSSEALAGEFFRKLRPATRQHLQVATKCGEHWNNDSQSTFVDHSYDALVRSIDRSMERLGAIDVLQIHKTTVEALRSSELWKALEHARACGISAFGASVSDFETGCLASSFDMITVIQFPFNLGSQHLKGLFTEAIDHQVEVWINRPFAMGQLIYDSAVSKVDAYRFIVTRSFSGAVLTGTNNPDHLLDDLSAFEQSLKH